MTRVLMFLNELSYGHPAHPDEVHTALVEFVRTLRHVRARRSDVALVTRAPLGELEVTPGYPLGRWLGQDRNRDYKRAINSLRHRAPIGAAALVDADGAEHLHGDVPAEALGAAYVSDGLAVSLPLAGKWQASWVELTRRELAETDDGDVRLTDRTVEVRHGSCPGDLRPHEEWIASVGAASIVTGRQLWEARADFFPHLRFLPRVEDQVCAGLQVAALREVRKVLLRLEAAVAEWDPARTTGPVWGMKVSPEHEGRKRLCRFTDLDGEPQMFDDHVRYTPGAGRIHFRFDAGTRTLVVAHIGPKL